MSVYCFTLFLSSLTNVSTRPQDDYNYDDYSEDSYYDGPDDFNYGENSILSKELFNKNKK